MRKRTASILVIMISAAFGAGAVFTYRTPIRDAYRKWQRGPIPEALPRAQVVARQDEATIAPKAPNETAQPMPPTNAPTENPAVTEEAPVPEAPKKIPFSFNLKVPFVPQAPLKIWDEIHEDTCEEASFIMLKAYVDDESLTDVNEMDRRLLAAVEWQNETYGDFKSSSAARTAEIMREHLGMKNVRVLPVTDILDVKRQIAAGHPVILPAAGKLLFNPNFKNGGPLYHMLVAKGYTTSTVITNDPGTRLGADYAYADEVLWNALHDWNGGDVESGDKVMIVVGE